MRGADLEISKQARERFPVPRGTDRLPRLCDAGPRGHVEIWHPLQPGATSVAGRWGAPVGGGKAGSITHSPSAKGEVKVLGRARHLREEAEALAQT